MIAKPLIAITFLILYFLCVSSVLADSPGQEVTLIVVGDVMMGRYIEKVMAVRGNDYPFHEISPFLHRGDIVFGNLESVISNIESTPTYPDKPYSFHASPGSAKALSAAGFTVINLANNHVMDYSAGALFETRRLLEKNGLATFGAGKNITEARRPAVVSVKGLRFGFLGYSIAHSRVVYAGKNIAGVSPIIVEDIRKDISSLRIKVDFIIISLHWGIEYEEYPTHEQQEIAHLLIDSGADMIIGHHPHVMQGVEIYKGKLVAYSLGNFVFDQKGKDMDRSFMLTCKFRRNALYTAEIVPLDRFNYYFPKIAEGEEKDHILSELTAMSLPINGHTYELSNVGLVQ